MTNILYKKKNLNNIEEKHLDKPINEKILNVKDDGQMVTSISG
jgi:hypothetical protein